MSLTVSRVKIGGTGVAILDRNTMTSDTITAGQTFSISNAILFYVSGGSILVNVSGTDKNGNTFGYKDESEAGFGNAGYYVNGSNMCPFVSGLGGVKWVFLIKNTSNEVRPLHMEYDSGAMAFYFNGYHDSYSFEQQLSGWGNMIKSNFNGTSTMQIRNNNDGGGLTRIFGIGIGSSWEGPLLTVTPYVPDPDNPYYDGDVSGPGGGDPQKQNWSENSDIVKPDNLPDESYYGAVACGLITIFHPTKPQLQKLAEVIWGQGFFNFVQNLVENISDLFISLGMLPFTVTHGRSVEVTWFDFIATGQTVGTGIFLDLAPNQWLEFDMGSIALNGSDNRIFASDSVLDYSPYSRLGIYLPFIGYQELDIDECRGQVLFLRYRIDVLSGTTVAIISLGANTDDRAIYEFTGNCLTQLPLTSEDAQSLIGNAVNIGIAIASAGATSSIASAGDALTAENLANGDISATQAELQNAQHAAQISNGTGSLASATANGIMGMKPNFKKSGAVSASATLMAVKQPYLFLSTPRQSVPEHYQRYCGLPSNITDTLGSFSGYTVVEDIRLNGLVATSSEVEEIYKLLKSGVII